MSSWRARACQCLVGFKPHLTANPPIVLLHGAWHAAWCWQGNFKEFFECAGFEVHTPDLPSHGIRQGETPIWRHRISTYVADMEVYLGQFDTPPVLIGHSMGGFVAQHLVAKGANLSGTGLLATIPPSGAWRSSLRTLRSNPLTFLKTSLRLNLRINPDEAVEMFLDQQADPAAVTRLKENVGGASYLAFLDMLMFDLPGMPKKPFPALVVGGGDDPLFPPATQQAVAERLGASCHIIPGAPHNVMMSPQWRLAAGHFLSWIEGLSLHVR